MAASNFAAELAATFGTFSGHIEATRNELAATSSDPSGHMTSPLTSENAEKGFNQGLLTSREEQAHESPPSLLTELERRGLRPKSRPALKPEQLAILERIAAEEEAKAKNGQEGKETA